MAYATGADLLMRYDARLVADLLADDGAAVALPDVATHPKVVLALSDASGLVDASLRHADQYQPGDLASLSGDSLSLLKRITCDIAVHLLTQRRLNSRPEIAEARAKTAQDHLERLRKGEIVLSVQDNIEAGHAEHQELTLLDTQTNQAHLMRYSVKNYYPQKRIART